MLGRLWHSQPMERLRRQLAPSMRFLLYQRVDRVDHDPFDQVVCPDHFAQQMQHLRQQRVPLSIDQALQAIRANRVIRRGVVVTFDNGSADHLLATLPILEYYEIPATIFIATGLIGRTHENWWDELQRLVLGPGELPELLTISRDGPCWQFRLDPAQTTPGHRPEHQRWRFPDPTIAGTRPSLFLQLYHALQTLDPPALERVMEQLRQQIGAPPPPASTVRMLTEPELLQLAQSPLITLGAQTHDHVRLPALDATQQRYQLARSRAWLEKRLDRPVRHLAYPHGEASSLTQAIAADVGFQSACLIGSRPVRRGVPPHAIPRYPAGNWDGARFATQLDWWH